jgi:hypothetical protein
LLTQKARGAGDGEKKQRGTTAVTGAVIIPTLQLLAAEKLCLFA